MSKASPRLPLLFHQISTVPPSTWHQKVLSIFLDFFSYSHLTPVWLGRWAEEGRDVWAWACSFLEMVTRETPFAESRTRGETIRRLSKGELPLALERIQDDPTLRFLRSVLVPFSLRPSSAQLLRAPFLHTEAKGFVGLLTDRAYDELLAVRGYGARRRATSEGTQGAEVVRSSQLHEARTPSDDADALLEDEELPEEEEACRRKVINISRKSQNLAKIGAIEQDEDFLLPNEDN